MTIIEQLKREICDVEYEIADIDDEMSQVTEFNDGENDVGSLNRRRVHLEKQRGQLQTLLARAYMGAL
jgi:hypothetical protein